MSLQLLICKQLAEINDNPHIFCESWKLKNLPPHLQKVIEKINVNHACGTLVKYAKDQFIKIYQQYDNFIDEEGFMGYISWAQQIKEYRFGQIVQVNEHKLSKQRKLMRKYATSQIEVSFI